MRRLAGALAVAVLLAGCGGDSAESGGRAPAGPASSTIPGAGGTTTSTPPAGTADPSGAAATTTGGGAPVTTTPSSPPALAPGGVGHLATALLRAGNGNRIVVEVRAQAGAAPATGTLDHLTSVLREVSGKAVATDGIDAIAGGARDWTSSAIASAADAAGQHAQGGSQVVLRLLFLRGSYQGDESVLGVAVRGDVAAIFSDQVDAAAGLLVAPRVVEDAVAMHEVGHLLGLVDLVLGTGRADPSHPGHSTNEDSVMFWAVESDVIGQLLDGGIPNDFDAQDLADLGRIRSG